MKPRIVFSSVIVWLLLSLAVGQAQPYSALPMPSPSGEEPVPTPTTPSGLPVPSDWLLYRRSDNCCGPVGGDGPIQTELYVRSGATLPIGGQGPYGDTLTTGWIIQGGGKLLFYNPPRDSAWILDLSISNAWNAGTNPDVKIPLNIIVPNAAGVPTRTMFGQGNIPGVTVRDLNRTFVNFGIGKMWYIHSSACDPGLKWRWGIDGGGRYGTASAQFHEIRERSDTIGGVFAGIFSDIEIPCGGCCIFHAGARTEWSYTWSDILQQSSDVEEINVLLSLGVRF